MLHGLDSSSSDAQKLTASLQLQPAKSAENESFVRSWNSSRFTDPKSIHQEMGVRGHQSKTDFQFIVHTAPLNHLIEGKGIFSRDAESAMASWDVACTSIVNQKKTYTYGSVGVILKVPQQNVLAASPEDLMSETNVGLIDRANKLVNEFDRSDVKSRYERMPDYQRNGLLKKEIASHQRHTNTPEQVLENTYRARNEILICTAEGVNIHQGEKTTGKVEIAGIFLNDSAPNFNHKHIADWKGETLLSQDDRYELFQQYAEPLAQELGLPIIYLNGSVDIAEMESDVFSFEETKSGI
ncbi:hypothetical protein [Spartinivicinus ruber]|uniref:hypothetical protein n=1 Tax=Spartinivicinus ruber TaxID=2683272 RepID=UPI0013D80ED5|nr:hypothetical protein [Spartinivicinus ruber]